MSFNEAALRINSFFDHEYPLLCSGLSEPVTTSGNLVSFRGSRLNPPKYWYSSHDGYDYGSPAKVEFENNVLAASSGIATFVNTCGDAGNAIYIDHENGFQTRYYTVSNMKASLRISNQPVKS